MLSATSAPIRRASRLPTPSWGRSPSGPTIFTASGTTPSHHPSSTLFDGWPSPLHENGVTHRDIKPANLVVSKAAPSPSQVALIDFGLAYSDAEDRFSKSDELVGNRMFSADPNLIRSIEPNPWLDVFQLAQLLIWMVQSPAEKSWPRPLDWRYVSYDPELSTDLSRAFYAVTAQSSEPVAAPRDTKGLGLLLDSLLPRPTDRTGAEIDLATIERARARGNAAKLLEEAGDRRIMEAWLPRAQALSAEVIAMFHDAADGLRAIGIECSLAVVDKVALLDDTMTATLTVDDRGQTFGVRAICIGYIPSQRRQGNRTYPPQGSGAYAVTPREAVYRVDEIGRRPDSPRQLRLRGRTARDLGRDPS